MDASNKRKNDLLGMSHGSAVHQLRKRIMFAMIQRLDEDTCYRCGFKITNIKELSVEHKQPWQSAPNPIDAFFDLNNIAFSHLTCNVSVTTPNNTGRLRNHGASLYQDGCRCEKCLIAKSEINKRHKDKTRRDGREDRQGPAKPQT